MRPPLARLLAVFAIISSMVLTGCTGDPETAPAPWTPTPQPVHLTEGQAIDQVVGTYSTYMNAGVRTLDTGEDQGLHEYIDEALHEDADNLISMAKEQEWTATGTIRIVNSELVESIKEAETYHLQVGMCQDLSRIEVLDESGQPTRPSDAVVKSSVIVSAIHEAGLTRITKLDPNPKDLC